MYVYIYAYTIINGIIFQEVLISCNRYVIFTYA